MRSAVEAATTGAGDAALRAAAEASRAWPFVEARRLTARFAAHPPAKGYALFETGYGPSGLPHIGTFGEVVRTAMVRHAFSLLSDVPTRLFAFSDDMDGLRKVPDNVPNQDMLAQHLGKPLTAVPDPFGTHDSFGAHNNARLQAFLDHFDFDYTFVSSTACYRSGQFDPVLMRILEHYEEVTAVVLPTLGDERRQSYSPFLPLCPRTGRVLQAPVVSWNADAGTIVYLDEAGERIETPVTGGRCKLQWKVDWAMRWAALDVDYEMAGKDLIDSVRLSSQICRILGAPPPEGFIYELFLDEQGEKISKSKGNGLSVEDWLRYGPAESLAFFMYQKPKSAKRLFFDVIPKTVDDYLDSLARFAGQDVGARLDSAVWHVHHGRPPDPVGRLGFSMLLNLISVCHAEDKAVLWQYLSRYDPGLDPERTPLWDRLLDHAIGYYRDVVKPGLQFRRANEPEAAALRDLAESLRALPDTADGETIQTTVYEVGKRHFAVLKDWFQSLYQILLGQNQGPRMGSFIALYGLGKAIALIEKAAAGDDLAAAVAP